MNDSVRAVAEQLESRQLLSTTVGMNLDGVVDYNPAWMFTDAFLGSRDWISHSYDNTTGLQNWEGGGTVNTDARGWPTHLNQFTDTSGHTIQQRLGTLMLDGRGVAGHYPAGAYRAEWTGTGTLTWGADAVVAQQGDLPGGRHFATLNVNPTQAGVYMRINAMSDADPIRDVHVWMPDYNGQSFAGQVWRPGAAFSPFHPLFRERLDPFDTIRFMQPQDTNTTDIVHWSDRKPVDFARQATFSSNFQNGLAPEYMIELANELHSNAWFCMPHTAEDDFVRGFAQLVHDSLDPQKKAYVEFSNELWNGAPGFEGSRWLQAQQALPENAGLSGLDIWAREAKRDFDIWSSVFADAPSRLIRVVAGQAANPWIAGQLLQRMGGAFDAVSCDGYVGFAQSQTQQFDANTTVDQVVNAALTQSLPTTLGFLRNHEALAQQYSAQLGRPIQTLVYEGGPLFFGGGQPYEQAFLAASRDPRMYDLYSQLLRGANDIGVDQFDAYVFTDTSAFADASHLRWQDQPLLDAHKYRALLDAISGTTFIPQFSIRAETAVGSERGQQAATFRVTRSGSLDSPLNVTYTPSGTASAADYTGLPSVLSFAAGESSKLVTITPIDDTLNEGNEVLTLMLTAGGQYTIDTQAASASITIRDDDDRVLKTLPIANAGFESGSLAGWTLTPSTGNYTAVGSSITDPSAPAAAHGGSNFAWGAGLTGNSGGGAPIAGVSQQFSLADDAAAIDAGAATLTFHGWGAGNGAGQQSAFLEMQFIDAAGNALGAAISSNAASATRTWTEMTATTTVPVGARSVELRALAQRAATFYANRAGFDDLAAEMEYPLVSPPPPPPPPPPVNVNPVARDDSATTLEDAPVVISVLGNDTDTDGDSLIVTAVGTPLHGIAALNASGTISYTPESNYNGSDAFTYSISDGHGGSATASVAVSVTPVNDAPTVVQSATASSTTITGRTVTLTALGADVDASGEAGLTYTWTQLSGPTGVAFSANGTNAAKATIATFTQAGSYAFQVTIADLNGPAVAGGSVNVTVVRTLTTVRVTPATASVPVRGTVQLSARAYDQWDLALSTQPSFTWSIASGGGTVSTTGLFTASSSTGTSAVRATVAGRSIFGTATITITVAKSTAPSNLVYSKLTNRRVKLTWKDNSGNEQGFRVQTSTNGTTWSTLATLGPGSGIGSLLSYTTGSFAAGKRYFRIVAYNAGGTSASNTVTVTL